MRRARVILLVMLAAGAVPRPQEDSGTVIQQDVRIVHVLARVKDKNGRPAAGLTAGDFILQEDGRPQKITHCSRSDTLPLSLGLLIDTSRSQRRLIEQEKTASRQFFEQVLRPDTDQACLLRFDFEAALMKNLTRFVPELEAALQRVRLAEERLHLPPDSGGTVLYDAVYLAAGEVLATPAGQKAMVVISDGVDFGSMVTLGDAITTAQRAETAVYCIRYADPEAYQRRDQGGHGGGRGTGGSLHRDPLPHSHPGRPDRRPHQPARWRPRREDRPGADGRQAGVAATRGGDRRGGVRHLRREGPRGDLPADNGRAAQPVRHRLHPRQGIRRRRLPPDPPGNEAERADRALPRRVLPEKLGEDRLS